MRSRGAMFLWVVFIITLMINAGCVLQQPARQGPRPGEMAGGGAPAAGDEVALIQEPGRTKVVNRVTGQEVQIGSSRLVKKIKNKPADIPPLVGVAFEEGLQLANEKEIYLIETRPGFKLLSVYPNPRAAKDKVIIDKSVNRLYFYKKGQIFKIYPVATGKDPGFTPEGSFKIANKIKRTDGDQLKPQLGDRWMGLVVPYAKDNRAEKDKRAPLGSKYGIHGTNEPQSIGKYASGGCIRMDNNQVRELFELVKVGTPVEIINGAVPGRKMGERPGGMIKGGGDSE